MDPDVIEIPLPTLIDRISKSKTLKHKENQLMILMHVSSFALSPYRIRMRSKSGYSSSTGWWDIFHAGSGSGAGPDILPLPGGGLSVDCRLLTSQTNYKMKVLQMIMQWLGIKRLKLLVI
ncbi:hypothetical protein DCAR_0727753 [Daucus carota subsp. sativus]|uniref:Uncharacterized protein n=1 Tax=Daucus carota subsp. sativus TaxID=79200 RepID=A0A161Y564_DAUCS|nr:hypothetical protein DCAR_0727753 [Daucus carota subsp. sativus]